MYNLLIDVLPTSVEIGGVKHDINSNFTTSILFSLMINDENLSEKEKLTQTLELYYYPQQIPNEYIGEAIDKALWFYSCDKEAKKGKGKGKNQKNQIYSFEDDAEYIYSAFLDQYNIDLNSIDYLHWFKFKALFKALKEDNEFVKIMGYRAMDLTKIKDKDQKKYYKEMQELYKIEKQISDEELAEIDYWKNILK